jgi:predicted phage-related endonuclease
MCADLEKVVERMIERRLITDRAEWLEWRKLDVTASTVGGLFGVHPYVTALRLYAEKRGTEFEPLDDNKIVRRGRWLEPAIGKAVREMQPAWSVEPSNEYYRDPDLRLGATPDFLLLDEEGRGGVLQAKTAAPHIYRRDWQDGKEPPLWILLQAATEMLLTGAEFAVVAVMVVDPFSLDVTLNRFERTAAVEDKIIRQVEKFWQMVDCDEEPEPDFGRDDAVIRALHPRAERGSLLDLRSSNEVMDMLVRRADANEKIKGLESEKSMIEAELRYRLGDHESALVEGFKVTYKNVHMPERIIPESNNRQLRIYDQRAKGSTNE